MPLNELPAAPATSGASASSKLLEKHQQIASGARGVKPGTVRGPYNKGQMVASGTSAPVASQPVYPPETGETIARTMFSVAGVLRQSDDFDLDDREAKALGPSYSQCLNQFAPSDAKWVSLSLLAVSTLGIFMVKEKKHRATVKAKKILEKPEPKPGQNPQPKAQATAVQAAPADPFAAKESPTANA